MAGNSLWLNLAVAATCLAGFVLLALASERQGGQLLGRPASRRDRLAFRTGGWPLLVLALFLCAWGSGWSIGAIAWLGWLGAVGASLVFALPRWTERQKATKATAETVLPLPRSRTWRKLATTFLICGPVVFAWALHIAAAD